MDVAGCIGKVGYDNFAKANKSIRRKLRGGQFKSVRDFRDSKIMPYKCRDCGRWHVGNGVRLSGQHLRHAR